MKKILILLVIISMFVTSSAFAADQQFHFVVKHIFDSTEITTVDEYGTAGTEYTIQPLTNQEIEEYEDGIWEVAYTSIDGGNSQIEENYDSVIIWPTRATTITLIPDDTAVEYHYVFSKNVHVVYEWEGAPESVTLPIDEHGYKDGAYTKETINIDETYKAGDVVEEGNYLYTFSGWTKNKKNNKIIIINGNWDRIEKEIEKEPVVEEPIVIPPKEDYVPEPPHTGI